MSKKYFIITVDTEGDNLWSYKKGEQITTHNTKYIPRFQELCEKYGFKPVYLTNYEMLCDDAYVHYVKHKEHEGLCEVGLHLHAWNNPPLYDLDAKYDGNPYLIEYPDDVMRAKFDVLYKLFCEKIGHKPYSHRAGRWAMDERYFKLLEEYSIKVDCSVTPHIDWSRSMGETRGGSDFRQYPTNSHWIGNVLEVPLTVLHTRTVFTSSWKHNIRTLLQGRNIQLRLATHSLKEIQNLVTRCAQDPLCDYVEFMLHSSELMPNGSPYFKNEADIDAMFQNMEDLYSFVARLGYGGGTLNEYFNIHK